MLIRLHTLQPTSMYSLPVTLEVNISRGIKMHVTGGATALVRESRQRIYAVIKQSDWHWPGQRITINVLPTQIKKSGAHYDLPIALGILCASKQLPLTKLKTTLFAGELNLKGELTPYPDPFNIAHLAQTTGCTHVLAHFTPQDLHALNQRFTHLHFISVATFSAATDYLRGATPVTTDMQAATPTLPKPQEHCMSEVAGQRPLKRALEIAAAGGHHLLMIGPPGVGKTMLATRFAGIQPPPNPNERDQISALALGAGMQLGAPLCQKRPFLAASRVLNHTELLGKGAAAGLWAQLLQGQTTDHRCFDPELLQQTQSLPAALRSFGGALFLDEFTAYSKSVHEDLLQHLDTHKLSLLVAMNPCPCGNFNHPDKECRCSASALSAHQKKLSGAMKDRLDMVVYTSPMLWQDDIEETSAQIKARVERAWSIQIKRQGAQNAQLSTSQLEAVSRIEKSDWRFFYRECARQKVSIRGQRSLLALARTLADLEGQQRVTKAQLILAFALRFSDRASYSPVKKQVKPSPKKSTGPTFNLGDGTTFTVNRPPQ